MRNLDLYNVGDSQGDIKQALLALRRDFDAHNHDGINSKDFQTLQSEMAASRVFSVRKKSYTDTTAGFWAGLVGATVKLFVGTGSNFLKWDGSQVTMSGFNLVQSYTAGEAITSGRLVGFKRKICTWGNYTQTTQNRSTTAILSSFVYVDQDNPNTNFGSGADLILPKLGVTSLNNFYDIYGKIDLTSNPPGLPAWNEVMSVKLRMYVVSASGTAIGMTLTPVDAAFTEGGITWNNKPANLTTAPNAGSQKGTAIHSETMSSTGNTGGTGYVEFDITELYRLWSAGKITNNGFSITAHGPAGSGNATIGGRTRTDSSDYNQAPYLVITPLVNNPGSGNTMTVIDGKMYHMSNGSETLTSDKEFNNIDQVVGIAAASASAGASIDVYILAEKSLIPSSVFPGITAGQNYYLTSSAGLLGTLTNDIIPSSLWTPKIGIGSSSGLIVDFDKKPVFIKSTSIPTGGILPPPGATMALITMSAVYNIGSNQTRTVWLTLHKDWLSSVRDRTIFVKSSTVATYLDLSASWASGTSGLLTVTRDDGDAGTSYSSATAYWFK